MTCLTHPAWYPEIGAPLDDLDQQVEQVKGLAPRIIFLALGRDEILAGR